MRFMHIYHNKIYILHLRVYLAHWVFNCSIMWKRPNNFLRWSWLDYMMKRNFFFGVICNVLSFFSLINLNVYVCDGPFCNVGLGCLLPYWTLVFWIKELRLVQLQLTLIRLVHKLCLVCQEHAHGRQSYFGWVMASRYDNNKRKYFCL